MMISQRDDAVLVILTPFSRSQKDLNALEGIHISVDQN